MFCPRCGSNQSAELKFCKACGANLSAVRQVVDSRDPDSNFDWSKTWVAEMFMSAEEQQRRKEEMERRRGITPATRRYQEIKAGVITSLTGVGVGIFLGIFMQGIILSGKVEPSEIEILSRLWVVGVIPLFVGMALIINGYFVSRKIVELSQSQLPGRDQAEGDFAPRALRPGDTSEFISSEYSVTEGTTQHLGAPKPR
jgi:hypothetical protein